MSTTSRRAAEATRRARRISSGSCTLCDFPPLPGLRMCEKHHSKRTKASMVKESRGICRKCPNPIAEGSFYCLKCKITRRALGEKAADSRFETLRGRTQELHDHTCGYRTDRRMGGSQCNVLDWALMMRQY